MIPDFSPHEHTDKALRHAVTGSKHFLQFSSRVLCSNPSHILFSELRKVVVFAVSVSPFVFHVGIVVGERSEKQVVWPHAQAIVAVVTDEQALWNRAVREFVSGTMRPNASVAANENAAIALESGFTRPQPTAVSFVDLGPETSREMGFGAHGGVVSADRYTGKDDRDARYLVAQRALAA